MNLNEEELRNENVKLANLLKNVAKKNQVLFAENQDLKNRIAQAITMLVKED